MVAWHEFTPSDIEYDEEKDKLALHGVSFDEAVDCFFNEFEVGRNKSYSDRFKLYGRSNSGRALLIIFQLKPGNVVRIITGWPI